jgi:hypothetical protein
MIANQIDALAELQLAFRVLTKNLSLTAIPIAAMLLSGGLVVLAAIVAGASGYIASGMSDLSSMMGILTAGAIWFGIALLIALILGLIAEAAVIGGSELVWEGRTPDLSSGLGRAFGKIGDLFLFGLVAGILFVAVSWTVVGPLVLSYFFMYAAPAIVIGNQNAFGAIGTSWRLSTQNFGPSASAFLGLIVVGICAGIVNVILGFIPVLGHIVALLVFGFVLAYAALVAVRFYDLLMGKATPAVASAIPAAPVGSMPTPTPYSPPPPPPPVTPPSP